MSQKFPPKVSSSQPINGQQRGQVWPNPILNADQLLSDDEMSKDRAAHVNSASEFTLKERPKAIRLSSIDFITPHPLDTFWRLAIAENYDRDRINLNELHLSVPASYCDYHIALSWNADQDRVSLILAFEGRILPSKSDELCRLLVMLNERQSSGHFDYWKNEQAIVYRNDLDLSGGASLTMGQAMSLIADAVRAAEKGYPASQFVIWAGMSAEEACANTAFEHINRR